MALLNPWAAVRKAVEEAAQDETLSPDARLAKLRLYRDDLNDMLGAVDTYIGGLELVREGRSQAYADQVMEARADADIRALALERELADAETLDALGYLSHDDLDALSEEGLMDDWLATRAKLREVPTGIKEASLGDMLERIWDQAKHPRGQHGRFRDVLGRTIEPKGRHGGGVPRLPRTPGGERGGGGFGVHHEEKFNAFVGKAAEHGKFQEVHPEGSAGAREVLGNARDSQDKFSTLEPRRSDVAPEYEGPEGMERVYTAERKAVHDGIVASFFRQRKMVVTTDPVSGKQTVEWKINKRGEPIQAPDAAERTMVFLAGGTASGKSASRVDPAIAGAIPHPQDSVTIDPDEIKQMLPEYNAILSKGDESAAGAVHEESSDLAKRILREASARGLNIVMDGTGDSKPGNFPRKIQNAVDSAKQQGHSYTTKVLYFDAPVDVALAREQKRAATSKRKVHEHTVRSIHAGVSVNFPAVQQLHEQGVVQHLAVHDTTDGPHLIAGDLGPEVGRIGGGARVTGPGGEMSPPINVGGDVARAAELLAQGRHVELNQPRELSTLLDKMSAMVKEAEKKGEKAPTFDLCRVSVKGTNLFCRQSKGIPRVRMPQFKGEPIPGSRADRELPKNEKGRVSLDDAWREHLKAMGVRTEVGSEKASRLRASQTDLNGANAARIMGEMRGGRDTLPIFVSRDNYILDGHHQWAARVGLDSQDGKLDLNMPTERIDMPITDLLEEARRFTKEWGLKQQSLTTT